MPGVHNSIKGDGKKPLRLMLDTICLQVKRMNSDDKINFILCEYNQIFNEIRTINSNISTVAKYYGGLLTSLIIYVLVGVNFYTASQ